MKLLVALLGLLVGGCAATTRMNPASAMSGQAGGAAEVSASGEDSEETAEDLAPSDSPVPSGDLQGAVTADSPSDALPPMFPSEALHQARIELAREELVENNLAKARLDLQEELERELANLQGTSETTKSRVRHARPHTKH
ncbi:MAG TPA: hypothetical protein VGI39_00280 [Polyangiaceae bacterium]